MAETPTDDPSIDPADLWSATKDQLDDLDDDPVAAGQLANEFAADLALAVHEGSATETVADPLLKQFARGAGMKKSKVESQFESELEALEAEEDEAKEESGGDDDGEALKHSITHLLEFRLKELTIYKPSDASAKPRYSWKFDTGVEVETETEHQAPNSFCQCYYDASGATKNAGKPDEDVVDGSWTDYIRDLVTRLQDEGEKVRVVPVVGVRTQAVEDLKDTVESKPATTDLQTAAQQYRPYVESEDADVVHVPSAVIERVLANFEDCSYNDLQIELDKRENLAGTVRPTQVGRGTDVRLWQLNREWLDIEVETPDSDDEDNGGDARDDE